MLSSDLKSIGEQGLQALCDQRSSESSTLDFKRDLPGNSDRDKHEFLKDVCGLANADGGDLVYGVDEAEGVAAALKPHTGENADEIRRRLGQVLDAGIEPRVRGLQLHPVACKGGTCLVVRVPASFDGPHRYLFNQHSKFVMRNGTHTSEMTYQQLRSAFDRTSTLTEQARAFVAERTGTVQARRTWRPLELGPICLVHVVPIASLSGRLSVDVHQFRSDVGRLMFSDWGGASGAFNLDGVVAHPGGGGMGEAVGAYTQLFRNGAMEAGRSGAAHFVRDGEKWIPATTVSAFFRDAVSKLLGIASTIGATGPAIIRLALLDVSGFKLGVGGTYWHRHEPYADRPDLVLPEAWVEEIGSVQVDNVCRPQLDILWQAFGMERCLEYKPDGTWSPRA